MGEQRDANHTTPVDGIPNSVANISTSNRFDVLTHAPIDGNENVHTAERGNNKSPTNKRVHCPPITVLRQDAKQIRNLLKQNNISDDSYHMKGMNGGVLVITKHADVHKKITQSMKTNSLEFFTHQISSETPIKIVLFGLHLMDTTELVEELDQVGVKPTEVKPMNTSNVGLVPYLLHFANGTVRLQDLQKIRYVCNSVVRWKKFIKKPGNVVQCHRCQRYGHGSKCCNLKPVCVKCSQNHLTSNCGLPSRKDGNAELNNSTRDQIRCANCGENHTANYKGCNLRKSYLQRLASNKAKRKTSKHSTPASHQDPVKHQRTTSTRVTVSQPAINNPHGGRRLYSQVVRDGTNSADQQHSTEATSTLFTISEFMGLARDLFSRLKKCKSKEDQFLALSELMIQYIFNGK